MVTNAEVAHLLREAGRRARGPTAKFRAAAYGRAADEVEAFPTPLAKWFAAGHSARSLPGVGPGIAATIEEAVRTGTLEILNETPSKRRAKVDAVDDAGSLLWSQALAASEKLVEWLRGQDGVKEAVIAGDVRLGVETVRELVFVAAAPDPVGLLEAWLAAPFARQLAGSGDGRITLVSGHKAALVAVKPAGFWAAVVAATGNERHVQALQAHAAKRKAAKAEAKPAAPRNEAAVYAQFGLPFIESELRQGAGEIEAAASGKLPKLVQLKDVKCDLHTHTDATDGTAGIAAMVDAAAARGLKQVAITDHTQRTTIARGLTPAQMERHLDRIAAIGRKRDDIEVLLGAEIDILKGGALDLPAALRKRLDVAVCSLHHRAGQDGKTLTSWMIRAMENEHAHILGHPTGRMLGKRDPIALDFDRLFDAARDGGWAVELDGQADRLDLPAPWVRRAKALKVPVSLSSDAHSIGEFANMDNAVKQARRGWLEPKDIVNCKPWKKR